MFITSQETFTQSVSVISTFLFNIPPCEVWEQCWAMEVGCSAPDTGGRFRAHGKTMSQARAGRFFMMDSSRTPDHTQQQSLIYKRVNDDHIRPVKS